MKKQNIRQYLSLLLLLFVAFPLMSFTVVIDAGHGGHDAGAIGLKLKVQEKNLNLSVAKQLAEKIRTNYPEVKVVLTRDTDVFLPLQQRADIANKHHADLFISIHTNAAENRNAQGAETFILGTERMEDNLDVAMRENAVMKLEEDQTVYQGFDPNSIESYILFELMQNQYMDHSLQFAELVQNQFVGTLQRANRGVRQAAFWVLLKSACPSVLVEMGFLSNAEEEKWLASAEGKTGIVNGIFDAFQKFYTK
jgi:N-acetylmuramoyl-L-alanine amidase